MSTTGRDGGAPAETARIELPDGPVEVPVLVGTENERALSLQGFRAKTGYITLDEGYGNTGSCRSAITFVDGEHGILRYRGYPVEELAEQSTFLETALLLYRGELPTLLALDRFRARVASHALLHEGMRHHFEGFPPSAHPMAILSAMISATSCYRPELLRKEEEEGLIDTVALLLSKVRTIAAFSYKKTQGLPVAYPDPERGYADCFLNMMFSLPHREHEPAPEAVRALDLFLILHADHEQNCSTSTARMVGSSGANMFASVAAAVCALWGRLHGGANVAVIQMLEEINQGGETPRSVVEKAKRKEYPLWGFGHRVYKNCDPRVAVFKKACDELLREQGRQDPLLGIAKELEGIVMEDPYFEERKLHPNLDFYSGILLRALDIPTNMFTVMFAIGRMPGWIAHWTEGFRNDIPLNRPRQVYTGPAKRSFVPLEQRD